jgi:hypothetical protein
VFSLKIKPGDTFSIGATAIRFERKPENGKFYLHIDAPEDTQVTPPRRGLHHTSLEKDRI